MGYYYETEATGVPDVDAIGHAIDSAGKAYHHTSDWHEQDGNGRCVLDDINDALKACAAEITRLRTAAPVVPVVTEAIKDADGSPVLVYMVLDQHNTPVAHSQDKDDADFAACQLVNDEQVLRVVPCHLTGASEVRG